MADAAGSSVAGQASGAPQMLGKNADHLVTPTWRRSSAMTASNIAVVRNGVILCPPMDNLILGGITYELMIELARANRMPLEIRRVHRREVKKADELWIMSSTKEVVPIVTLDEKPVGSGKPGPIFRQMKKLFDDYKQNLPAAPALKAAE